MADRKFTVYFAVPRVGTNGEPLATHLQNAHTRHGRHLPSANVENERFQFRSLERVHSVWKGTFAKLRDDAPNYVDHLDEERELDLAQGSAVIEKSQFLYREQDNVIVWQVNRLGGSMTKAAAYLSSVLGQTVILPPVQNNAQLEDLLNSSLYEIEFQYAQPQSLPEGVDMWSQRAFDITRDVGAAYATYKMRAGRGRTLAQRAGAFVRTMLGDPAYKRVKVRVSEDSEPVKLFLASLKEEFTIDVAGRYPDTNLVFEGLEDAYTRQQAHIIANI